MDFLKVLFNDDALTYDEFMEAIKANNFKLADLSKGNYVSKSKYDSDLASKDEQITKLTGDIAQRDSDLDGLKLKLTEAGNDVEKLNKLTNDFSELQGKYDADIKGYKEQLKKQEYEFAVRDFASSKRFTSNAAKRDFIQTMISKGLTMDGGKILGAEDFANAYSADNSDAFYVETEEKPEVPTRPTFVDSTPGTEVSESNPFHFSFTGVKSEL